jgi:hypothetical protein
VVGDLRALSPWAEGMDTPNSSGLHCHAFAGPAHAGAKAHRLQAASGYDDLLPSTRSPRKGGVSDLDRSSPRIPRAAADVLPVVVAMASPARIRPQFGGREKIGLKGRSNRPWRDRGVLWTCMTKL